MTSVSDRFRNTSAPPASGRLAVRLHLFTRRTPWARSCVHPHYGFPGRAAQIPSPALSAVQTKQLGVFATLVKEIEWMRSWANAAESGVILHLSSAFNDGDPHVSPRLEGRKAGGHGNHGNRRLHRTNRRCIADADKKRRPSPGASVASSWDRSVGRGMCFRSGTQELATLAPGLGCFVLDFLCVLYASVVQFLTS